MSVRIGGTGGGAEKDQADAKNTKEIARIAGCGDSDRRWADVDGELSPKTGCFEAQVGCVRGHCPWW